MMSWIKACMLLVMACIASKLAASFSMHPTGIYRRPLSKRWMPVLAMMNSDNNALNSDSSRKIGVIIIDHGSKRQSANLGLIKICDSFKQRYHQYAIVEPAHMELAEPSIATAYQRCVEQGATSIICHPYFLSRGRHVAEDVPQLVKQASECYPNITYHITDPLGAHPGILQLIDDSISGVGHRDD